MSRIHGTLLARGSSPLETTRGDFVAHRFLELRTGDPFVALTRGDVRSLEPLVARIHSSCVTSEAYAARDCDCAEQLEAALAAIERAGRGVVFYLLQEGRGAGFVAKTRDRMLVQASGDRLTTFEAYAAMGIDHDLRRYETVPAALALLGIEAPLRLLTNNPEKASSLTSSGVRLESTIALEGTESPFNAHYLSAKSRSGHLFASAEEAAEIPSRVVAIEPEPVGGDDLLRVASYLLPVASEGRAEPDWFRCHVHYDTSAKRERVVLEHEGEEKGAALLRIELDSLLARFPLRDPARRPWPRAAARLADAGTGFALFLRAEGEDEASLDDADLRVLAARLGGRRARLLVDGAERTVRERRLESELRAAGFALEPAATLA